MKVENIDITEFQKSKLQDFKDRFIEETIPVQYSMPAAFVLLGDHTHYNEGLILSAFLDRETTVIFAENNTDSTKMVFQDPDTELEVDFEITSERIISELLKSLHAKLVRMRLLKSSYKCCISTTLTLSMGLSYYSSILQTFIEGALKFGNGSISPVQKVEILYEAVYSVIGKIANKAYFLNYIAEAPKSFVKTDLRGDKIESLSADLSKYSFLIISSQNIIHNIKDTCNQRIDECEVGVKGLKLYKWGIKSLRDIESTFLTRHLNMIPRRVYNRVFYNVTERERVEMASKYIYSNEIEELGKLINESHNVLEDKYELNYPETTFLQKAAVKLKGVIAAKFISCSPVKSIYAIVETESLDHVTETLSKKYTEKYNKTLSVIASGLL